MMMYRMCGQVAPAGELHHESDDEFYQVSVRECDETYICQLSSIACKPDLMLYAILFKEP